MAQRKSIRSDIACSDTERITVKGHDLCREIKQRAEEEATAPLRQLKLI